jgi:hypothetical protein
MWNAPGPWPGGVPHFGAAFLAAEHPPGLDKSLAGAKTAALRRGVNLVAVRAHSSVGRAADS